jgi:hypothetical protein
MDLLHGLREKLRFIESMYGKATANFVETKRKIENSEGEFDYSSWDPESYDGEPPFLAEWQEADEALNLLGQASVTLVQSALKEYLDGCLFVTRSGKPQRKGKESWFDSYQRFFNEQLGVDWTQSPGAAFLNRTDKSGAERRSAYWPGIWNDALSGRPASGAVSERPVCGCDVRGDGGAFTAHRAGASAGHVRQSQGSHQEGSRFLRGGR